MTIRHALVLAAVALLVLALALRLRHQPGSDTVVPRVPGVLNADVSQATIGSTICVRGWTATIRPPVEYTNALKLRQMRRYGETGPASAYQEDHLISLELGGDRPTRGASGRSRIRARPTSTRSRTSSTPRCAAEACRSRTPGGRSRS